jgi:peptidyl-dipeptidase Dcp
VVSLVRKRAERAALLGYESHAAYQVEIGTARTVGAVDNLLSQLVGPVDRQGQARGAPTCRRSSTRSTADFQLAPWDWDFYAEKVRKARYAFDESQLKPYFELNRVLENGVFYAAHQLYGITFKERHDLPGLPAGRARVPGLSTPTAAPLAYPPRGLLRPTLEVRAAPG